MSTGEVMIYLTLLVAYFVPFYIAMYRRVNGIQLVFWFNVLVGWTVVAWVLLVIVSLSLRSNKHSNPSFSS